MCDLCKLVKNKNARHTKVWYEDDRVIIIDCETCGQGNPMMVFKEHTMTIKIADLVHIMNVLYGLFGGFIKLRIEQRKILEHLHWHVIR